MAITPPKKGFLSGLKSIISKPQAAKKEFSEAQQMAKYRSQLESGRKYVDIDPANKPSEFNISGMLNKPRKY